MYKITLAKTAGFCFGVRRAVDRAFSLAEEKKDAVLADTTGFELPQSVALIRSLVEKKLGKETAR